MTLTRRQDEWKEFHNPTLELPQNAEIYSNLLSQPPKPTWFDQACAKLESFKEYNQPNWDDEGSHAIERNILIVTAQLLKNISIDAPAPQIIPGYKGEIKLIWATKGYEIFVTVKTINEFIIESQKVSPKETKQVYLASTVSSANDALSLELEKIL